MANVKSLELIFQSWMFNSRNASSGVALREFNRFLKCSFVSARRQISGFFNCSPSAAHNRTQSLQPSTKEPNSERVITGIRSLWIWIKSDWKSKIFSMGKYLNRGHLNVSIFAQEFRESKTKRKIFDKNFSFLGSRSNVSEAERGEKRTRLQLRFFLLFLRLLKDSSRENENRQVRYGREKQSLDLWSRDNLLHISPPCSRVMSHEARSKYVPLGKRNYRKRSNTAGEVCD